MRIAVLGVALLTLGACQTPCVAGPAANEVLSFRCNDGSRLRAHFTAGAVQVVQPGFVTVDLPQRGAGSGYRYAGGGVELRGRGGVARWTRPGAGEVTCTAPLRAV